MEAQQDALDMSRLLNINLTNKVDQLKAQLLAILPAGSSAGPRAPTKPKISNILSDPSTFDGTRGKKFEEWWTCI